MVEGARCGDGKPLLRSGGFGEQKNPEIIPFKRSREIPVANSTTAASTSVNRRCRTVGFIVAIDDSNLSATVYSVKAAQTDDT